MVLKIFCHSFTCYCCAQSLFYSHKDCVKFSCQNFSKCNWNSCAMIT